MIFLRAALGRETGHISQIISWTNKMRCGIIKTYCGGEFMISTISDGKLSVSVNSDGATLSSLKRMRDGREFLWQGSEDSWTEQDVVIFPFVARQKDGWYTVDGKRYDVPLHGVCRHQPFSATRVSDTEIVLTNVFNEDSLTKYPYKYEYSVRFKVDDGALTVVHTAKNVDDKLMYFMMGAHPAFNICATYEGGKINTDGNYIDFLKEISPDYLTLEEKGHYITGKSPFGTIDRLSTGKDVMIGLDCASSEFYKDGIYDYTKFEGPNGKKRTSAEQVDYLEELIGKYPIDSIEDGMSENDWEGWKALTDRIGSKCQLVGDDLFVTNVDFLSKGIAMGCANSILIKVNQIGSLSETLDAIEMAHRHGYTTVTSHRSGETEDATIADIAVATNSGQIKTGSLSRSDRMAKYNQLLRIEEELGDRAVYGYKRIR